MSIKNIEKLLQANSGHISGANALIWEEVLELQANLEAENRGLREALKDEVRDEMKAKLDAVKNVKTFGSLIPGSSDGTYRVVQWAKWDDVLEALGEVK